MATKNRVEVRIAGKDYTLMGVESDEYIHKIAHYIDKKMLEITRANHKLSTAMAAVLTALNVADDYFKASQSDSLSKNGLAQLNIELFKLKQENVKLVQELEELKNEHAQLVVALTKRESELQEARSTIDKMTGNRN